MISPSRKEQRQRIFGIVVWALSVAIVAGQDLAWSQGFPSKAIKIVVPFEPGSASDIGPRGMQEFLAEELKVPVILENKPGASGMVGAGQVLKARADGYTIVQVSDSVVMAPFQSPNPTYDPFRDFLPICQYGQVPAIYGVHAASPFKTLADFVNAAKKNPGNLNVGTTVIGGAVHVSLELFKKDAGLDFKIVPYKGTASAVAALLGRHLDMLAMTYMALTPYVNSGEMRVLAVTDKAPGGSYPTTMQAGYPRTEANMAQAYLVSAKTPKPIYEKLVRSFERVSKNPALIKKLEGLGMTHIYRGPADYYKLMKRKLADRTKYIQELNIKTE